MGARWWTGAGAVVAVGAAALLGACERGGAPDGAAAERAPGPARIVVSIAPLEGLVRELAPDAQITLLIPPGVSEHGYELTPGDVATVRRADLVVGVGMGLEARLEELIESMDAGDRHVVWFSSVLPPAEQMAAHSHGDAHGHEHSHGDEHAHGDEDGHNHGVDPHLWLDPVLVDRFVSVLAPGVEGALARAGAGGEAPASLAEAQVAAAAESLRARVRAMDARTREALAPLQGRAIVTHHASHGRFADRYGLRVAATIRVAETMEPSPGQIAEAVSAIQAEGVPAVFVEPQFDATTASRIAEAAGVRVAVLDPIGDGDWFALMEDTVRTIVEAFGGRMPDEAAPGEDGAERGPAEAEAPPEAAP